MTAQSSLAAIKSRLAGPSIAMDAAIAESEKIAADAKTEAAQRRAKSWNRVKSEIPEHADFITGIAATFGKPKALIVSADNLQLINTCLDDSDVMLRPADKYAAYDAKVAEWHRNAVPRQIREIPGRILHSLEFHQQWTIKPVKRGAK